MSFTTREPVRPKCSKTIEGRLDIWVASLLNFVRGVSTVAEQERTVGSGVDEAVWDVCEAGKQKKFNTARRNPKMDRFFAGHLAAVIKGSEWVL